MSKLYKCAKNCGNVERVEEDNDKAPVCCGIAMKEFKKGDESASLGCLGCMGCYGGFEDGEE